MVRSDPALADVPARRHLLRTAIRSVSAAALSVATYYRLPLDEPVDASTFAGLAIGIGLLAAIVAWQVRAIIRSEYPRLRAVEALFVAVPLLLVLFAATYFRLAGSSLVNFAQPLSRTDALYFAVTVFSTVGFGDISAKSEAARVVVTLQMVVDLVLIGLGVRALLNATQVSLQRRSSE